MQNVIILRNKHYRNKKPLAQYTQTNVCVHNARGFGRQEVYETRDLSHIDYRNPKAYKRTNLSKQVNFKGFIVWRLNFSLYGPRWKELLWQRVCAKLDIPINARVSVFGHVLYPVLNSTPSVSYAQVLEWG